MHGRQLSRQSFPLHGEGRLPVGELGLLGALVRLIAFTATAMFSGLVLFASCC
ncbi:hypothetical protein BJX63DRAFT_405946 [Aspergillus granulosus]|uniref:Uncharacterized protein n=1 Tax=Aspergillus granulosus TaxID=176169 RepID=A0ABR4H3C1_9EURO